MILILNIFISYSYKNSSFGYTMEILSRSEIQANLLVGSNVNILVYVNRYYLDLFLGKLGEWENQVDREWY